MTLVEMGMERGRWTEGEISLAVGCKRDGSLLFFLCGSPDGSVSLFLGKCSHVYLFRGDEQA